MRGTQPVPVPYRLNRRIIPADAGNTYRHHPSGRPPADHPRGCGEHRSPCNAWASSVGSSPRMRGAQGTAHVPNQSYRIIPADAGNTTGKARGTLSVQDHPRGCGEHPLWVAHLQHSRGSSPRMRGTPGYRAYRILALGIIPADAGNTVGAESTWSNFEDHPRGCGEHCIRDSLQVGYRLSY